jgi:Raf kinase inhibitor-like YbhB/YbcL family protein
MKHHYHHHHHAHSRNGAARHAPKFAALGLTLAAVGVGLLVRHKKALPQKEARMTAQFQLTSPAFESGERIPVRYTCKGANVSPPLELRGVPADTQSLAIILHDPDAPRGDYLHWAVWDIHPGITTIPEDSVPVGAVVGSNDFGDENYGGPCPPTGTHHYEFDAYALDASLGLAAGSDRVKVMQTIEAHSIASAKLVGSFSAGS